MTIRTMGMRTLSAIVLIVALTGAFSRASAQEEGSAGSGSVYVGAACAYDGATDASTCTFTPADASGAAVYSVTLPYDAACATVIGSSGVADGSGYTQSGSLSVTFAGTVGVGGGASYLVATDAGTVGVPGDGLICGGTSSDPGDGVVDTGEVVDDSVVDDPVDDETQTEETSEGEGETDDQGTDPAETTGTPEPTEADDVEQAEEGTDTEEVIPPDVTVAVTAFDCPVVPASGTDGCTPSAGVSLSAAADGVDEPAGVTDVNGAASFTVPEGSQLVVTEDQGTIPAGYSPYGNGVAIVTASVGGSITFLHLLDPVVGRLQIFNGTCPTPGDPYTEFRVTEPRSVAMADSPACVATGGTVFTLSGGSLGSGISITTGSDGNWRGFLPAGTYTVTDDSGAFADVTVIVDDISFVMVIDYYSRPVSVLNVSRFACEDPNPIGVTVSVHGSQPAAWSDGDCAPTTGQVSIDVVSDVSAASVGTYPFDSAGQVEIELDPGSYLVTDVISGQSTTVILEGGVRVWTLIQDSVTQSGGVGKDPDGNPDGPDDPDNPDDGTGANPDGQGQTGGPGVGAPTDGTDTTGGVDAGANDGFEDYDAEVASVSGLPDTGAGTTHTSMLWAALALITLFLMSTGVLVRRQIEPSRIKAR